MARTTSTYKATKEIFVCLLVYCLLLFGSFKMVRYFEFYLLENSIFNEWNLSKLENVVNNSPGSVALSLSESESKVH